MADTLTFGAFAALMKVSRPAVSKAYKSKRLNKSVALDAKGRPAIVDVELAKREWASNSSRPVTSVTDTAPRLPGNRERDTPDDETGDEPTTTLSEAQRLVTMERARKLKLENDLREGQLVEVEKVRLEFAEIATTVKARLRAIPDAVADQVVSAASLGPAAIKGLLLARIDDALRELARGAAPTVDSQDDAA